MAMRSGGMLSSITPATATSSRSGFVDQTVGRRFIFLPQQSASLLASSSLHGSSLPRKLVSEHSDDSPTYILEITADGQTRKVRVYAPYDVTDKRSLRRFRLIWSTVFHYVRSPDGGDGLRHIEANS